MVGCAELPESAIARTAVWSRSGTNGCGPGECNVSHVPCTRDNALKLHQLNDLAACRPAEVSLTVLTVASSMM